MIGVRAVPGELDALARELWEAHATDHQQVVPMPTLHWDELDPFTRDHWRVIARAALAFGPGRADRRAAEVLAALLSHADLSGLEDKVAHATLSLPPALLDDAFAVVGALQERASRT